MSKHTASTDATLETIDAGVLRDVCGGKKKEDPGQGGAGQGDGAKGR